MRLLVTSEDGYLYMYGLNFDEGGDGTLIKQFQLSNFKQIGEENRCELLEEDDDDSGEYKSGSDTSMNDDKANVDSELVESNQSRFEFVLIPPTPVFLVESSYADRLRNRQPDEMTGNYD